MASATISTTMIVLITFHIFFRVCFIFHSGSASSAKIFWQKFSATPISEIHTNFSNPISETLLKFSAIPNQLLSLVSSSISHANGLPDFSRNQRRTNDSANVLAHVKDNFQGFSTCFLFFCVFSRYVVINYYLLKSILKIYLHSYLCIRPNILEMTLNFRKILQNLRLWGALFIWENFQ